MMSCRWLQKRIMRYTLIICEVRSKSSLEGRADEGIYDMLPPAFPAMLAACASSTEVSLTAYSGCGDGKQALVAKDSSDFINSTQEWHQCCSTATRDS